MLNILTSLIMWLLVWRSTTDMTQTHNGKILIEKSSVAQEVRHQPDSVREMENFWQLYKSEKLPMQPVLAWGPCTVDSPRHDIALYSSQHTEVLYVNLSQSMKMVRSSQNIQVQLLGIWNVSASELLESLSRNVHLEVMWVEHRQLDLCFCLQL